MEEYYNIKRLALVLAVQAEIEAMKLDNEIRKSQGLDTFNYQPENFLGKAEELRKIAYAHNDQL